MSSLSQASLAEGFRFSRKTIQPSAVICRLARRLWPSKTAQNLSSRAGVSKRAADLWLEERGGIGADAIVELLRSDVGYAVLTELMAGARVSWWRDFERSMRLADMEEKLRILAASHEALRAEIAR